MGAFAGFREWFRDASVGSRTQAAAGAILAVVLFTWLLVPSADRDSSELGVVEAGAPSTSVHDSTLGTGGTAGPGETQDPTASGVATSGESPGTTGRAGPDEAQDPIASVTGAPDGPPGCQSPPGASPGITGSEIKIAIGNTEIVGPAGNDVFGIPSAAYLRSEYEAVIDSINRNGGVACRRLVAQYHKINPADRASMQKQCLEIADSGVYAVIDDGGWAASSPTTVPCFAQAKLLYLGAYFLSEAVVERYYPYIFSFYTYEELFRNTAFALRDRGFFQPSNGFVKLGLIYRDCDKTAVDGYVASLREAGVADSQIVRYSFGCPSGFASPADIQQAVLTFQREGVTHVTMAFGVGDLANFTKIAQRQGFRPKYGLPDETLIPTSYGSLRADPQNIAGAIAITVSRNGEDRTPGFTPSTGTARCDEIMKSNNIKST